MKLTKKKREIIWSSKSERLDYEYLNKTNNIHMTSIGGNIFMEREVLMKKNRGFVCADSAGT